jgi:hypothetical protein
MRGPMGLRTTWRAKNKRGAGEVAASGPRRLARQATLRTSTVTPFSMVPVKLPSASGGVKV